MCTSFAASVPLKMARLGGKPGAEFLALQELKHTEEGLQVLNGSQCTIYIILIPKALSESIHTHNNH
jgi:hypothetical protein